MSYTSGRTVKANGRRIVSPTAAATKGVRSAIRSTIGPVPGITINTRLGYDLAESTTTTVTVVTYPTGTDVAHLRITLMADADILTLSAGPNAMTITRRA